MRERRIGAPRGAASLLGANLPLIYCGALAVLTAFYFLRYPIRVGDFDLWMWLAAGRFIHERGVVPTEAFFSFLTPPRKWVDYSWLSQVVFYQAYRMGGYRALIALRAAAALATCGLVFGLLFEGRPRGAARWGSAAVFAAATSVLLFRSRLVRPHLFSSLLIAAFLYLLEARPRAVFLLPALAVLFCNLHGIYYPVLLLILGAYAVERLAQRRASVEPWGRRRFDISLGFSCLAVLATPNGLRLLPLPFKSTAHAAGFILESHPVSWAVWRGSAAAGPQFERIAFAALVSAAVWSAWAALSAGRLRSSHGLLAAGGLALLVMGPRATQECSLLLLPLLRAEPLLGSEASKGDVPFLMRALLLAAFLLLPIVSLRGLLGQTLILS